MLNTTTKNIWRPFDIDHGPKQSSRAKSLTANAPFFSAGVVSHVLKPRVGGFDD
jgi:hypothetical protein